MKEMVKIALTYYETSSPDTDLQKLAIDFFNEIDHNKDGKVTLNEFLRYMNEAGLFKMSNRELFKKLDVDGDGSLDFKEVMGLYYVIKSGRPFCGGCGRFVNEMFFTCSICFHTKDNPFCVCPTCFGARKFLHDHEPIDFMDNYAMLESKRKVALETGMATPNPPGKRQKVKSLVKSMNPFSRSESASPCVSTSTSASTSTAIVHVNPGQEVWRIRLAALEAGLNAIGGVSNAVGAVVGATAVGATMVATGSCHIM